MTLLEHLCTRVKKLLHDTQEQKIQRMKKRSKSIGAAANTLNNSDNNSLFEGNSRSESHHNGCTGGGSSGN